MGETSEDICQEDINIGIDIGKERRKCCSDNIKVRYVIWCRNMTFWNLFTGAVGLRVTKIWGESDDWKLQAQRW